MRIAKLLGNCVSILAAILSVHLGVSSSNAEDKESSSNAEDKESSSNA